MVIGALEAGGTKMVCAIGNEHGEIKEQISIPTETPDITLPKIISYYSDKHIDALGLACFGPVCLDKSSDKYGYITSTPKTEWKDCNIVGTLQDNLAIPIGFDTDVNGSMLGEATYGQAQGIKNAIYITVGTGIGVGVLSEGKMVHGMMHPEAGHIPMVAHPDDIYRGHCPYHERCFEGMASGPAIEDRWGKSAKDLSDNIEVWKMEAYYIAQACYTYILTLSPQMIILGGGVMHQEKLFPMIREEVLRMNHGYTSTKELKNIDQYIVPASLCDNQGIMGAIKLGLDAYEG